MHYQITIDSSPLDERYSDLDDAIRAFETSCKSVSKAKINADSQAKIELHRHGYGKDPAQLVWLLSGKPRVDWNLVRMAARFSDGKLSVLDKHEGLSIDKNMEMRSASRLKTS